MKKYVTEKDKMELMKLLDQIVLDLKKLFKNHKQLKKLTFEVLSDNLNKFIQNEYWRRKYKKAPSYLCKLYLAIQFCRSYDEFVNYGKNKTLITECDILEMYVETLLTVEDLTYVRDNVASMVQAKIMYNQMIKKKQELKQGESFQIEPHGKQILNPNYKESKHK